MEFSKIISVAGKPGLFHAISQTKSGFIVEGLDSIQALRTLDSYLSAKTKKQSVESTYAKR